MSETNFKSQSGFIEKKKVLIRETKPTLSNSTVISDSWAVQNCCGEFSIYRCIITHTLSEQLLSYRQTTRMSIMHLSDSLSYHLNAASESELNLKLQYEMKTEKGKAMRYCSNFSPREQSYCIANYLTKWKKSTVKVN